MVACSSPLQLLFISFVFSDAACGHWQRERIRESSREREGICVWKEKEGGRERRRVEGTGREGKVAESNVTRDSENKQQLHRREDYANNSRPDIVVLPGAVVQCILV